MVMTQLEKSSWVCLSLFGGGSEEAESDYFDLEKTKTGVIIEL